MANTKISDMTSLPVPPADEPIVPVVSDGNNYRSPLSTLLTMPDATDGTGVDIEIVGGDTSGGTAGNPVFGGGVEIIAGNASGDGYLYGGYVNMTAGDANYGGSVFMRGGDDGGIVRLYAGPVAGQTQGGVLTVGFAVNIIGGETASTGGNINLTPGHVGDGTTAGEVNIGPTNGSSFVPFGLDWYAGDNPGTRVVLIATRPLRVKGVVGRLTAANAGASTAVFVKCANNTAPASGTAVTSTSMNCAGTPNANQTLTLSATAADLDLAIGDALVCVSTGTFALSSGGLYGWATPV